MFTNRIMFIPWKKGSLGIWFNTGMDQFMRYVDVNQTRAKYTHHQSKWSFVYLDARDRPFSLVSCESNTKIYIAGHGNIGNSNIYPPEGGNTVYPPNSSCPSPVSYEKVVQGLIKLGLSKKYHGKISCNSCFSGLGTLEAPPFARLIAEELWKQGFTAVCVVGYKGLLYSKYSNIDPNGDFFTQMKEKASLQVDKDAKEMEWQAKEEEKLHIEALISSTELDNLGVDKINPGINNIALRLRNMCLDKFGIKKIVPSGGAVEKLQKWTPLTGAYDLAAAKRGIVGKLEKNNYHRIVHMDPETPDSKYVTAKNAQILFKPSDNEVIFYPSSK